MKTIFLSIIFCLVSQSFALADFEQSLKQSANNKRDIIVILYGSDWRGGGHTAAQPLIKDTQLQQQYNLCPVDMKESLSDAEVTEQREKNKIIFKAIPVEKIRSFPALLYFDHLGQPIGLLANFSKIPKPELVNKIQAMQKSRQLRDQAWSKAEQAQTIEKASFLGDGLSHVDPRFARSYASTIKQIKQLDPKDQSGYNARYSFAVEKFRNFILKDLGNVDNLDASKAAMAASRIQEQLANDKFSPYQRQQIYAIKFGIYRSLFKRTLEQKHADAATQSLKDLIAEDSTTLLAINAKYMIPQIKRTGIMAQCVSKATQAMKDRDLRSFSQACQKYNATRNKQFGSETLKVLQPQQQLLTLNALPETGGRIPYSTDENMMRGLSDTSQGMIYSRTVKNCAITLEFPQQNSISSIQLIPFDKWNDQFPLKWRILSSNDGKAWTQVASFDKPTSKKALIFNTKDLKAKFIKVTGEEGKKYSLGLYNFVVYGKE